MCCFASFRSLFPCHGEVLKKNAGRYCIRTEPFEYRQIICCGTPTFHRATVKFKLAWPSLYRFGKTKMKNFSLVVYKPSGDIGAEVSMETSPGGKKNLRVPNTTHYI